MKNLRERKNLERKKEVILKKGRKERRKGKMK